MRRAWRDVGRARPVGLSVGWPLENVQTPPSDSPPRSCTEPSRSRNTSPRRQENLTPSAKFSATPLKDKYYVWSEVWDYDGPETTTRRVWSLPESSRRDVTDVPRHVVRVDEIPLAEVEERVLAALRYFLERA
jgi:hypothetical protein